MPDRIIRDELLTSERYWSVGIEAQRLFVHLLLSADALGRFSGKNYTIRSSCYPGIAVSEKLIEKLISDLHDADLIRIYQCEGDRYIFIPRYRQRLRAKESYLPSPPKEINDITIEKSDSSQTQVRLESDASPPKEGRKEGNTFRAPPKPPVDPAQKALAAQTWESYRSAYAARYRVDPVRNAAVNTHIKNLVGRIGQDAPAVAAFYVTHNDNWYVKKNHAVSNLLADCEGLRTQWKSGVKTSSRGDVGLPPAAAEAVRRAKLTTEKEIDGERF